MNYEERIIDSHNDNLHENQPRKKVILHEAIDNIV
jgi:hypothetical protein